MLYLWDEQANLLVMATSLCAILVDCWKVQRAMSIQFYLALGFVPWFSLVRLVRIACMTLRVSHTFAGSIKLARHNSARSLHTYFSACICDTIRRPRAEPSQE